MAGAKAFYRVSVEESDVVGSVERMQDSIERVLTPLSRSLLLDGVLLPDLDLDTTAVRVEHKLGRKPLGYIVVRSSAAETVYNQQENREDFFLNLAASGPVTVSLWIF